MFGYEDELQYKLDIAIEALRCYCDKSGWYAGYYIEPKSRFSNLDFDNLAAKALDLILKN